MLLVCGMEETSLGAEAAALYLPLGRAVRRLRRIPGESTSTERRGRVSVLVELLRNGELTEGFRCAGGEDDFAGAGWGLGLVDEFALVELADYPCCLFAAREVHVAPAKREALRLARAGEGAVSFYGEEELVVSHSGFGATHEALLADARRERPSAAVALLAAAG